MCVPTDDNAEHSPRRRHRATYLAPSRHQQRRARGDDALMVPPPLPFEEEAAPLLVLEPQQNGHNKPRSSLWFLWKACGCSEECLQTSNCCCCVQSCYRAVLDLILLVVVLVMSCFLYDIEVNVRPERQESFTIHNHSDRRVLTPPHTPPRAPAPNRMLQRWGSGRVVLQNQVPPAGVTSTPSRLSQVHASLV